MRQGGTFRWDDDLAGPAQDIAGLDHTPIRVLAGPGTGKTFALMRRVARLLQKGATANRILVCTFTRTAARDLEGELAKLGVDGANAVRAGTLHAFCFGLLRREEVLDATGRVPRPLLAFEEQDFLLKDLNREKFGLIYDRKRRLQASNAAWARFQPETPGWPVDPIDRDFERELSRWLRFHEAMLIGELVPESLRYLQENPASPEHSMFEHVLVDEYQDLNRAEQDLLDMLAKAGFLIVVGDENQSIYSFKHAYPDGIANFAKTHTQTRDVKLNECRRCPRRVVELANALLKNNQKRTSRVLVSRPGNSEGEVLVLQWRSMEEEADGIAKIIHQHIEKREIEPGRCLILAPRRQFGYAVRDALNSLDVDVHSFFREQALDKNDAQEAFTLLTLLANREDRVALRCWCGFGSPSLRHKAWAMLQTHCETTGESPWAGLERLESGDLTIPYTKPLIPQFQELQKRLSKLEPLQGQTLVDAVFPEQDEWTGPVRSLAAAIEGDTFNAEKLRESLRTSITQPELPTDVDYVRVMTPHKSKGLTADLVAVVGCIEGLVPTQGKGTPAEKATSLEEQRRLFYVAITRTKRILILSSVTRLPRNIAHRMGARVRGGDRDQSFTVASTFIRELGPTLPRPISGANYLRGIAR